MNDNITSSGVVAPAARVDRARSPALTELWREQRLLAAAEAMLGWDQETYMPPGSADARAAQVGTLAAIRHERLTSEPLLEAIVAAESGGELERVAARRARRDVERARRLSSEFARRLAEARIHGITGWQRARASNDFSLYLPHLRQMLAIKQEEAARVARGPRPYDTLLDEYEPGLDAASFGALIEPLARDLEALVDQVRDDGAGPDPDALAGTFPIGAQLELAHWLASRVGFDLDRGRIDASQHPFCVGLHPTDVRLTWRGSETDPRPGLFGALHELGHGLYEQGLQLDLFGSPLGEPASLGVHESQSRFWENHVGRRRAFWRWLAPELDRRLPGPAWTDLDRIWPALNAVSPSLIRVDADETTYHLHIAIRFELERDLVNGELDCEHLPDAWSVAYEQRLGLTPPDANRGVLQDVHWASGLFGYFPTYTIGTLFASQLWATLERECSDVDRQIANGEFSDLLLWLRDRVHRSGARYEPGELVERATGEPLGHQSFLDHVRSNVQRIYGRPR